MADFIDKFDEKCTNSQRLDNQTLDRIKQSLAPCKQPISQVTLSPDGKRILGVIGGNPVNAELIENGRRLQNNTEVQVQTLQPKSNAEEAEQQRHMDAALAQSLQHARW